MSNSLEQIDIEKLGRMQADFSYRYDQKVTDLTQTYKRCMDEMKRDFDQQLKEMQKAQATIIRNHQIVLKMQDDTLQAVQDEKHEMVNERAKIQLEQKKLNKMKLTQHEISSTQPVIPSVADTRVQEPYVQRMSSTTKSTSSNTQSKKKAADFYFTKGKQTNQPKATEDFMTMKNQSPQRQPQTMNSARNSSPKRDLQSTHTTSYKKNGASPTNTQRGNFTYDTVEVSQEFEQPAKKWSTKKKGQQHYIKRPNDESPAKAKQSTSPYGRTNSLSNNNKAHKQYVPPALATKQPVAVPISVVSTTPVVQSSTPDMPQTLVDEFKKQPENYDMMDALHNQDHQQAALKKWNELGVCTADEIIKNSSTPVNYHLRVSENDIGSAYGQVDKNGQMQGIGREVFDFIYEGQFKDNVYHGWGRYISHLGVYWGIFENGMRHGKGKFQASNGGVQEGNWNMGVLK